MNGANILKVAESMLRWQAEEKNIGYLTKELGQLASKPNNTLNFTGRD